MAEAAAAIPISLLGPILGQSINLFSKLAEANIFAHRGASVDWSAEIMEQEWHFHGQIIHTRIGEIKSFFDRIGNMKDIEIQNATDAVGYTIPPLDKDLSALNILNSSNNILKIRVRKMLELANAVVVCRIRSFSLGSLFFISGLNSNVSVSK